MPWSDPTIRFRLALAASMFCTAVSPSVGLKKLWPCATTFTPGAAAIALLNAPDMATSSAEALMSYR